MKKLIVLIVILIAAADAYSQVGVGIGTGGMGVGINIPLNRKKQRMQNMESKVQQMRRDLSLDSAQTVKVRGLLVERERRKNKGEPMPREEFNRRMDEILTTEQKEKFKEMHRQKRQERLPADSPKPDNGAKKDTTNTEWDDVYK
jgi:hypothetical protein